MGRKVDLDDLLDAREVAELLGLASANAVNVYLGRYRDFPEPVLVRPGFRLWLRSDVEAWARETGRSRPGRRRQGTPTMSARSRRRMPPLTD